MDAMCSLIPSLLESQMKPLEKAPLKVMGYILFKVRILFEVILRRQETMSTQSLQNLKRLHSDHYLSVGELSHDSSYRF